MDLAWTASCPDCMTLTPEDASTLILAGPGGELALRRLSPALHDALSRLRHPGTRLADLAMLLQDDGPGSSARFFRIVRQLAARGLVEFSVGDLATAVPIADRFGVYNEDSTDRPHLLSRFAYQRRVGSRLVIESPLASARLELHGDALAMLPAALASPATSADLPARLPAVHTDEAGPLFRLLLAGGFLTPVDEQGRSAEEKDSALCCWEFHDLLFHSRTREGRHDYPRGATYHMLGKMPPPPPVKPAMQGEVITLEKPALDMGGPSFAEVVERRWSVRDYADEPISLTQLSEFLYRVAHVKSIADIEVETPDGPYTMAMTQRPYPGAGGLYELELYPVVAACRGLERGLYHYAAAEHRLVRLMEGNEQVSALLAGATQATGVDESKLQVLIVVASRFQRISWKYSSIAYALTLKNVGVLYQTMYLTAAAMRLSPCGIGAGDADHFARLVGTEYHVETSVGEFLLGGRAAQEGNEPVLEA